MLDKTTGNDNLEHIASQTMIYTTPYVSFVLLIGKRRCGFTDGMKIIGLNIRLVHCPLNNI